MFEQQLCLDSFLRFTQGKQVQHLIGLFQIRI